MRPANVRALGAVQSEGFRAASEVVNRFVNFVGARNGSEPSQAARPDPRSRNPEAAMVLAGWEGILGQFAGSIRNGLGGSPAMDFGITGATARSACPPPGRARRPWSSGCTTGAGGPGDHRAALR
jgi:hypothetical protein